MARIKVPTTPRDALALPAETAEFLMERFEDFFFANNDTMQEYEPPANYLMAAAIYLLDLLQEAPDSPFGESGWRALLPAEVEVPAVESEKDFD